MAEKDQTEEVEGGSGKKKGGVLKTILMIGIPLMLVQTALAYVVISKFVSVPAVEADPAAEEEEVDDSTPRKLHMIEDVIVNPAGTSGTRFLNTTIALEYTKEELEAELVEKDVQIRDILIGIFVSKTMNQLDGMADKDSLRAEIMTGCNELLRKGKIKKVYFANFIMQ